MGKSVDESSFKLIFEHSPIPLWELDLTELFHYFDILKLQGIIDIEKYLISNPDEIQNCFSKSKIKQVNTAVLSLFEVENLTELIENISIFLNKKTTNSFKKQIVHFFQSKSEFFTETVILTKSGKHKSICLKIKLAENTETNQIIGIQSTEDITHLKNIEEQFKDAIYQSPDAISINRQSDGKFVFVNKTLIEKTGYTEQELIGKSALELNMWVNEKYRFEYFEQMKTKGFVQDFPAPIRNKNGQIQDTLISAKPIIYLGEPHSIVINKNVSNLNLITQSLKQSEEQFRKAFMNIPDAVHINCVSDAKFVDFNDYFVDFIGYSREELIGKTPEDLNIWTEGENSLSFYNKVKEKGHLKNLEISFRKKDGNKIIVLISSNILEFNGVKHIITTSRDISDLRKTQIKLANSEKQFRLAFMANPDPSHLLDLHSNTFVDVNDSFVEYSGFSREYLIGKKADELKFWIKPEDQNRIAELMRKHKKVDNYELSFQLKDGELLTGLLSTRLIKLYGRLHYLSAIRDITKMKQFQEALAKSEEKFQNIFSKSPDALAIMEITNWTYVDVNENFCKISGFDYSEIIGKSTAELNLWTNQEDISFFTSALLEHKEITNYESTFTLKNGTSIYTLISAKIITIGNKKNYLLIAKNISDFVQVKRDLFEKNNHYKTIVNNSYEGIAIINNTFLFDYVNHQMEVMTGYSTEELVGQDFRKILTTESAQIVGQRYKERQEGKEVTQNYTFRLKRKSGEIRTVELHSTVIHSIEGIPQSIAQILDITDREKAAIELEKEHQKSLQYFEVAGIMMMALDVEGNITAINKKGQEILESNENDLIGKNWFENFIPKTLSESILDQFKNSIKNKEIIAQQEENILKTISGKEKRIAWNHNFLKDEQGHITGMISSGEDISDKEEVSRILKMSGLVAILWKNEKGSPVEFVSENAEKLFGYSPHEFYTNSIIYEQLIHPEDINRLSEETKEITEQKKSHYAHQPYRIITKNGDIKWISDRTVAQFDSEGKIIYFYGILIDITEEINRSEKLRQANQILTQMNDGVITIDFSGRIRDWSGDSDKIFGYDNEEIKNENIQLIWGTNIDANQQLQIILNDIELFGFYQNEISAIHKNGNAIPLELTAKILYDSNENPLSLILVNRDITNRKIAQQALEESETRYRVIFESILDGVIIYNMNKEIVQVNKMVTQMYEFSYAEFTQSHVARYINPVQNHSFEEVIEYLDNRYDTMFEGESVDISKNGRKFFVNVKGRLIEYNNQPHLLVIVRDITKIKQAERDLLKAKEKAIESEKLKSAFLANMSHEIRTPMNSIIGFSDLLGDSDISNEEKKHFIRIIKQNGNQLMNIINDIIDISKIEAGHIQLNYEITDLNELFQDLYNMFELTIKEKGLRLIKTTISANKEFLVKTDELRLKQILINLISNALKFTPKGYIEFGCNIIDEEKSLHFYVKDSGIGISANKQEEIFQRFIQAESKTAKFYGGTGLGLAISKGLVYAFKGNIWLDSEESKGSTFNFIIPFINA